jgi:hypothetical protein
MSEYPGQDPDRTGQQPEQAGPEQAQPEQPGAPQPGAPQPGAPEPGAAPYYPPTGQPYPTVPPYPQQGQAPYGQQYGQQYGQPGEQQYGQPSYPAYGQPYGTPYGQPYPHAGHAGVGRPNHPKAGLALGLGLGGVIGAFVCGLPLLLSPFAWAIGARTRREIRESNGQYDGDGMAQAGMILGIVGTVLLALAVIALGLLAIGLIVSGRDSSNL